MWGRFLHGLVFGAGFGLSFVVVWYGAALLWSTQLGKGWPSASDRSMLLEAEPEVEMPEVALRPHYIGSLGVTSARFVSAEAVTLAAGDSSIRGLASANGKPISGLKLRLLLNGRGRSQWAVTNSQGVYDVPLPAGDYRVDGYELDQASAHSALSGMTNLRASLALGGEILQAPASASVAGPNFRFARPIEKRPMASTASRSDGATFTWEPYPGATTYRLRLMESEEAQYGRSQSVRLGERWWGLEISETQVALSSLGDVLKPGRYYKFNVEAFDASGQLLSVSNLHGSAHDFQWVE